METMTRAQFSVKVAQLSAAYRTKKDGVEWWQLRDGTWVGAKEVGPGMVQVKRFAAGSCNCG